MKFVLKAVLTLVGATIALLLPAVAAPTDGGAAVRGLYDALLGAMHNGQSLGPRGRYAQIEPVVKRVFDIPFMTRLAVGSQWSDISEAQRRQASEAFGRYLAAVYAERFDSYAGERLEVTGEKESAGGPMIMSRIVKSDGEPVNLNYLMREEGGIWKIVDVYLDGTISEVATRRSEFAGILRAQGIIGLIQTLNAKADSLISG